MTITPKDNDIDEPNRTVKISATSVTNTQGVTGPASKTLTITDDDAKPTLEIALDNNSISENGGVARVTARLTGGKVSSAATTITISASGEGFTQGGTTLTIGAGKTDSEDPPVTITGVDNNVDAPDKTVTVSVSKVTNSHQAPDAPTTPLTLTIEDDEEKPTVTLISRVGHDRRGSRDDREGCTGSSIERGNDNELVGRGG